MQFVRSLNRHDQQQESKIAVLRVGSAQAEKTSYKSLILSIPSGEVTLQQTLYPVMATVKLRERSCCFKHIVVWQFVFFFFIKIDAFFGGFLQVERYDMDSGVQMCFLENMVLGNLCIMFG